MLESPRHHCLRAMECVGLCPAVVSSLSHLGTPEWTARPDSLVDGREALVVQHPLAAIPPGLLGHAPLSSLVDAIPGQLARKGGAATRLVQCRERFCPHLTQTGHSRTLFVNTSPFSTLLKKPKLRVFSLARRPEVQEPILPVCSLPWT